MSRDLAHLTDDELFTWACGAWRNYEDIGRRTRHTRALMQAHRAVISAWTEAAARKLEGFEQRVVACCKENPS